MALIESTYTHRDGATCGIGYRRWVIAEATLRACLAVKGMRWIVWTCWIFALLQGLFLFGFGQLLDPTSAVFTYIRDGMGPMQGVAVTFQYLANDNPDIAIGMTYNLFFYLFTGAIVSNLTMTLIALGMAIPRLITSDLSSRAITIYSSKAVSRFDYCLGKFGGVLLLMILTWLGPTLATWMMGNLLAPKLSFFWYTAPALLHSLLFVGSGIVFLGLLALGVSAVTQSPRSATAIWVAVLLLGAVLSAIGLENRVTWLQYLSFWFNLELLQNWIFNIGGNFAELGDKFPSFMGMDVMKAVQNRFAITAKNVVAAMFFLSLLAAGAVAILHKRVKPE